MGHPSFCTHNLVQMHLGALLKSTETGPTFFLSANTVNRTIRMMTVRMIDFELLHRGVPGNAVTTQNRILSV